MLTNRVPLSTLDQTDRHSNIGLHTDDPLSDHIHESGYEGTERVPTVDFDYDAVDAALNSKEQDDEAHKLTWSNLTSTFSKMLAWVISARNLTEAGAKAACIQFLLHPEESKYDSYSAIAREVGMTRAAVSKWMLTLHDSIGLRMPVSNKRSGCREKYSQAQLRAVKRGTHTGIKRAQSGKRTSNSSKSAKSRKHLRRQCVQQPRLAKLTSQG